MIIKPPTKIEVKESPIHGLGIFCTEQIHLNEVIEICPFLVFPQTNQEKIPFFQNYSFCYPKDVNWVNHALVLGYGSFYNHSETPNADWHTVDNTFVFHSIKVINPGEEIFINYSNGSVF